MYMDIRKGIVKLILLCGAFFNTQDKIFPINKNQTKTNVSSQPYKVMNKMGQ